MVKNLYFFNYFVFRRGRMDYIWSSYIFVNRTDCWSSIFSPIKYLSPSPYQHSSFSTSIFRKSRTSYSIVSHWRWALSWSSCLSLLFLTGPVRTWGPSLHIIYLIIASITISTDILHYLYLWSASTCQTYFLHRAYDLQMSSDILFLIILFKNEFRQ